MKRRDPNVVSIADKYIGRDGSAPNKSSDAELDVLTIDHDRKRILASLGDMSPADFGSKRDGLAAELDTPLTWIDAEYKEARKRAKGGAKSAAIDDWKVEPWPDAVDGGDLLDRLTATASSHLVLPVGAADTIALWTLFAHCHDAFSISPLLAISSPTPECGKTTCLTVLGGIVPRPLPGSNITAAALFRAVEKWQPTLLIDEADTFLRDNDDLRGVLNSGHQRANAYIIRTTGDNHEPARFHTWSPKAIALIGKLPATLASRAIHIELRRKTATETVQPLRLDRLDHLARLQRMAARWAADSIDQLRNADPEMPAALYGRIADNWRPLLAIADLAGGDWPERARRIAETMSAGRTEETIGIMLLEDVRRIFTERGRDTIPTADMIEALTAMETRPWPEWKSGKPITPRQLAKLLEPFAIAPIQFWDGGKHRGYTLGQFNDAFSRYLGDQRGITVEPSKNLNFSASHPVGAQTDLPEREVEKPSKTGTSTVIPDNNSGTAQKSLSCDHCGGQGVHGNEVLEAWSPEGCRSLHRGCIDPGAAQ